MVNQIAIVKQITHGRNLKVIVFKKAMKAWEAKRLLAASFLFARWVLAFARGETNWSTNLVGACQWDRIFQWILLSAPTGRNVVHASTGSPSGQLPPNLLGSSGGQVDKAIRIALPGSVHWAGTFGLANWDMAL